MPELGVEDAVRGLCLALDVAAGLDVGELRGLTLESYRHLALARMLKALPAAPGALPSRFHVRRSLAAWYAFP